MISYVLLQVTRFAGDLLDSQGVKTFGHRLKTDRHSLKTAASQDLLRDRIGHTRKLSQRVSDNDVMRF